jgi:gliding motility-associated-like protein
MKKIVFLLFSFLYFNVSASHLVGGDIKYRYLGGNQYEVTFTIYKDCTNTGTGFDGIPPNPSFWYGVICEDGTETTQYSQISITGNDTSLVYNTNLNPCLDTTNLNICLSKAVYKSTFTVTDPTKAYYVSYQRCCRNSTIQNIVPDQISPNIVMPGSTYIIRIPPTSIYANNSAVFNAFPPKFICNSIPFTYNLSATDIDGDSLTYDLFTPYSGLTGIPAKPPGPTTTFPSFDTTPVTWQAPYSLANIMGGTPVAIDNNGVLTGQPSSVGQYVIGIRVTEWRNGVKLTTVNRDFQFNVKTCVAASPYVPALPGSVDPKTGIGFYEINCDSFSIKFKNQSQQANVYSWHFGDPNSGANDSSALFEPRHTFTDTGTFTVKLFARMGSGCVTSFSTKVAVYPGFKIGYLSSPVCIDTLEVFTDTSNHQYSILNKWTWDFGDATSSNLRHPKHKYTTAGTFNVKLTVQNNKGCTKTVTKPVTIYPDPVTDFTLPTPSCIYSTLSFVNTATIVAPHSIDTFFWEMDAWNTTIKNPNYIFNTFGMKPIKLTAKSDKGCYESITKNLFINPLPIIATSPDPTICWDASTPITVTGGISYKWYPTNGLSDSTSASITAKPLSYPAAKKYFVRGKDANQCENIDSITISYFPKPPVYAGLDTSVCFGVSKNKFRDSVQLTGSGALSYSWSPSAGLSATNKYNPVCKPKINTTYILTGTDINNCIVKDTMKVVVLDPSLDLIPFSDTFLCQNDSIEIRVLDQGDITKYFWAPFTSLSNRNIRSPLFFPKDTQFYILTVSNYCYDKDDSVRLDVRKLPAIAMTHYTFLCSGATYTMDATGPPKSTFLWKAELSLSNKNIPTPIASPKQHTKYYLTVSDSNKCKNKDSILIEVYQKPNIAILNRPKFVCFDQPFQVNAYSELNTTWVWDQRSQNSSTWVPGIDINDTLILKPIIKAQDTGFFRITATSQYGCKNIDSLFLVVQKPVIAMATNPVKFCENSFATLKAWGGLYYEWSPKTRLNNPLTATPQSYTIQDVKYVVKVSNDCFSDTSEVNVWIDTLQKIEALSDATITREFAHTLEVKNAIGIVEWSPNYFIYDQYSMTPTVKPMYNTTYKVKLKDDRGCESEDSVHIVVVGKTVVLLPNAFSPNGDGLNDVFGIIKHLNIEKLNYLKVYDRWGAELYTTTDINGKWDGKIKGDYTSDAVFIWTINAMTYDKETFIQSGNVSIVR